MTARRWEDQAWPELTDLAGMGEGEVGLVPVGATEQHGPHLPTSTAPVILLDEVVAHLDPNRRAALFATLSRLGAQVWMTGADVALFDAVAARAQLLEVTPGRVVERAPLRS